MQLFCTGFEQGKRVPDVAAALLSPSFYIAAYREVRTTKGRPFVGERAIETEL